MWEVTGEGQEVDEEGGFLCTVSSIQSWGTFRIGMNEW